MDENHRVEFGQVRASEQDSPISDTIILYIMKKFLISLLSMFILSTPVYADIVWPSAYIVLGMLSAKVIIAGLLIEIFFVKFFTNISWLKAGLISFVMNLITCLLGIILIPISGILIELITPFGSTFHWSHWLLSYLAVILINTIIEGLVIVLALKQDFKKIFWWLFIANAMSVSMCILLYGATMEGIKF